MSELYGSTSWRRVLALILVFVMMFSVMGTSGYSVFAEGLDETGEEVVETPQEAVVEDITDTVLGESPGEEESLAPAEDAEEIAEPEEAEAVAEPEEAEEIAEPEEAEAVAEPEEAEEIAEPEEAEAVAEPAEESEEAEEAEEVSEPAEETAEEEPVSVVEEFARGVEEPSMAFPATGFRDIIGGISVTIDAPEGAFPEGTEMKLAEVEIDSIIDAVSDAVEGTISKIKAVDISFFYEDEEVQPQVPISVRMNASGMTADSDRQVLHIDDEGEATVLEDADTSKKAVEFETDSFSVYVVVETIVPRLTVTFMNGSENGVVMYVKGGENGDTAEEIANIVYEPGVEGVEDHEVFRGWLLDPEEAEEADLMTIAQVRKDIKDRADALTEDGSVTYYAAIYTQYTVTYVDGTEKDIVVGTKTEEVLQPGTEAVHIVNMGFTVDDSHNFMGWIVEDGEENILDHPEFAEIVETSDEEMIFYYPNDTEITITGPVTFKPYAPEGHWLVFDENGKGGKYNAPQFVLTDEVTQIPVPAEEMTRYGYDFEGWYLESDIKDYYKLGENDSLESKKDKHKYVYIPAQGEEDAFDQFEFGEPLETGITVYANWKPQTTGKYTVMCWTQDEDSINKETKTYNLKETFVENSATIGTNIPYTFVDNDDEDYVRLNINGERVEAHYTGFCLTEASKNQEVEITPEGDAVLNLYFDRIVYNLRFYLYRQQGTGNNSYSYAENSRSGGNVWNIATWYNNTSLANMPTADYPILSTDSTFNGYTGYYFVLQAAYGEDISSKWPSYDSIHGPSNNRQPVSFIMMDGARLKPSGGTGTGQDTVKGKITVLDEKILGATADRNGNFLIVRFNTYNSWTYHIYYEALEGVTYANTIELNGKTYYKDHDVESRSSNTTAAYQNPPQYQGFVTVKDSSGDDYFDNYTSNGGHQLNYYYDRLTFTVSYFDGSYVDGDGNLIQNNGANLLESSPAIGQGAVIPDSVKEHKPSLPAGEEGYVFEGWFADSACSHPAEWSSMPIGGIRVYAKWRQIQYRVFLRPNVPEDVDKETVGFIWGSEDQAMNFRRSYGQKVSLPDGKITGYEFYGWYLEEEGSTLYAESTSLKGQSFLTDYDKTDPDNYTDDMDQFGEGATWNSDVRDKDGNPRDRFWIEKKLDLYGKWGKVLVGADGINLVYDVTKDGVKASAPVDNSSYLDNTFAPAGFAATPADPDKKAFDHWVLQSWNGSDFEDTETTMLPGENFTVLATDAKIVDGQNNVVALDAVEDGKTYTYTVQLKAVYKDVEKEDPTYIKWYSNYGSENGGKGILYRANDPIKINEAVDIYELTADDERENYTFLGWTKTKGGTEADFLIWTGESYIDVNENEATQVAADERPAIEDLYAVWEEAEVTINYAVAEGFEDIGEVSVESETVAIETGEAAGSVASVTDDAYEFAYWTCDEDEEVVSRDAAFVPEKNDDGIYEEHTYYAHFKEKPILVKVTVHHYLKGTDIKVAEDLTTQREDGESYTAEPVPSYQGKTLTVDSYEPSQTIEVTVDIHEITIYYTLALSIEAKTDKKVYNGEALDGKYTIEGALDGDLEMFEELLGEAPSITDAGELEYLTEEDQAALEDIPPYYVLECTMGTLTIEPAPVTITTGSGSKEYDGKALTVAEAGIEGLVNNETATVTATGSRTEIGSSANTYSIVWGETKSGNYTVTEELGTLEVTINKTAKIVLTAASDSKDYDGKALTNANVTAEGLPEGFTVEATASGSQTNVGSSANVVNEVYVIKNAAGEDKTANFTNVETADGKLTVDPAKVTVIADDKSKICNDKDPELTATVEGLIGDDKISYELSREKGEEIGKYAITPTGDKKQGNYEVSYVDGTLTITGEGYVTSTKTATSTPANGESYALGETITYEITVTNEGKTLTLTNILVTDKLTGDEWVIEKLAPGETRKFSVEYVVTEADILAGSVANEATVGPNPVPPDDPDNPPEEPITPPEDPPFIPDNPPIIIVPTDEPNPHLTVVKTATSTPENGEAYAAGETIKYEIKAVNDGNLTISDFYLTDELTGNAGEDAWYIESLAPGEETEVFKAEYVVTEADLLNGSVLNVATIEPKDPENPGIPEDPEHPYTPEDPDGPIIPHDPGEKEDPTVEPNPSLRIEKKTTSKAANGFAYLPDETIRYEIKVENDGNLTITNITVADELTDAVWEIEALAPGEGQTFETEYLVAEEDAEAGSVVNEAVVSGSGPDEKHDPEEEKSEVSDPVILENPDYTFTVAFYTNYPDDVDMDDEYSDVILVTVTPYELPSFVEVFGAEKEPSRYGFTGWELHRPGENKKDEENTAQDGTSSIASAFSSSSATEPDADYIFYAQWQYVAPHPGGGGKPQIIDPDPGDDPEPDDNPPEPGDNPPGPDEEPDDEIVDDEPPFAGYEEEPDEELDEEPTPFSPYTGDDRHTAVWSIISLLSLAGIAVVARKRKEE